MDAQLYTDPSRYGRQLGGVPECTVAPPPSPYDALGMRRCHKAPSPVRCHAPRARTEDCWDCCMPGVIETKILRRPQQCVKPACNYRIPAVPCMDPPVSPKTSCTALCFDWSVEAPGPNDSYGLNGLNWHDWKMDGKFEEELSFVSKCAKYQKSHPGFSDNLPPVDSHLPVCDRPLECYSRYPGYRSCQPDFATDVNYFRDWRCCEARPPAAWRPPYKQWATGRA